MGFPTARAEKNEAEPPATMGNRPRKRSSPVADEVAVLFAAGLAAATVWLHGNLFFSAGSHLYVVLATTIGFAVAARLARGVNTSGAIAGAMLTFVMASCDLRILWVVLVVFLITLAATRAGKSRKRNLKLAEAESGRSASQVMANLGVATLLLALPWREPGYLPALAALVEAAADTTSSEIGPAFSFRTVLITTWKAVSPGTDGGISLGGTVAGVIAALFVAASTVALGLASIFPATLVACAGVAGMLMDSVLGATLERRGYLNNDAVNLLGTAAAGLVAWLGYYALR